jgi:hypothetical protein
MKLVCITNKIKGKNLSNQLVVGEEYDFRVYEYDRQTIYFLTSVRDELNAWLIESLNTGFWSKKKKEKYISELEQIPSETCHTSIYLTCGNGHFDNYFCNVETRD